MAQTKTVKIVAARPFLHQGKRVETGESIEVPENVSMDILSTNRALPHTDANVAQVKASMAAAKAAAAKPAAPVIERYGPEKPAAK